MVLIASPSAYWMGQKRQPSGEPADVFRASEPGPDALRASQRWWSLNSRRIR